jgi:hypothetical protein
MLALLRPDSWNLPLFLHVLGAVLLVGATLAVTILAVSAWRSENRAREFARVGFWTLIAVVVPAWILMRVGAQLIVDKEFPHNASTPGWVDTGFAVSEPGLVLLIAIGVLAWFSSRRGPGRVTTAWALLTPVYLATLLVAVFAMSAKPGT